MADGIKFLIDLDARTKGAIDAVRGLDHLGKGAIFAAEKLKQLELAQMKIDHLNKESESHKGFFSKNAGDLFKAEMGVKVLEHAWRGVEMAVEKVRDIIHDTIKTVAGDERTRVAMTNLMGDPAQAEDTLKQIEKFSQLTEFTKNQSEGFGVALQRAGYKGQDFADALAAVGDAAAITNSGVEGAQEALSSLTRMRLTGKLDTKTVKGLGLDVRDVVKDIGNALGMTPDAVKKGLEAGAIPAAEAYGAVLRAMERKTGKGLGEAGMATGRTLSAKLAHMAEVPDRLMARLDGSPAMARLTEKFSKMLGGFDPDSPTGQKIVKGLETLMGAVADVDFDGFIKSLGGLPTALASAIGPISLMAENLVKLTNAVLSIPKKADTFADQLAQQKLDDQQANFRLEMEELRKKYKHVNMTEANPLAPGYGVLEVPEKHPSSWSMLGAAAGAGIADISRVQASAAPAPIIATSNVTINNTGKPLDHDAVKQAAHEGQVKAIEKTIVMKAGRSAKSKVGAR